MSEEKQDLVPVEEYEVLDQIDDNAIIGMLTGAAIQDYVYQFKQGGKTVKGLTLAGINEAANRRGGIQVDTIEYEERDKSWLAVAKAVDTVTGSSRYGAYEQTKKMGNRDDPHAFTKAVHKAQRNAVKQLLPMPVLVEVMDHYLNKGSSTPAQKALPKSDSSISNGQKSVFAAAKEMEKRFTGEDVSTGDFWGYVKRRYSVESRNDMSDQQWSQLSAELQAAKTDKELFAELIKRILQTKAAEESSDVETTAEEVKE